MMKLAVMKIVCLLVVLGSVVTLGLVFDIGPVQQFVDQGIEMLPTQVDGTLNLRLPASVAAIILLLVAGYGLLPRLRGRKNSIITYRGSHGDIVLQLKPIRKVLLKVMRKMPEVYSIKLNVKPDADGRKACILADVVLKNSAALGARRCAKMVADCLAATSRDVLGLEDLSTVRVNVKGVHVDIIATGRQMREQLALREDEEAAAYALAHPPAASVTLDEDSTDNRPSPAPDAPASEAAPASENSVECEEECAAVEEEDVSTAQASPAAVADIAHENLAEEAPEDDTPERGEDETPAADPMDTDDYRLPPLLDMDDEDMAKQEEIDTESAEAASSPCQMNERNWDVPEEEEDVPEAADVEDLPEAAADDEDLPPSSGEEKTDDRWS